MTNVRICIIAVVIAITASACGSGGGTSSSDMALAGVWKEQAYGDIVEFGDDGVLIQIDRNDIFRRGYQVVGRDSLRIAPPRSLQLDEATSIAYSLRGDTLQVKWPSFREAKQYIRVQGERETQWSQVRPDFMAALLTEELVAAIEVGNLEGVRRALRDGADANRPSQDGMSDPPLYRATGRVNARAERPNAVPIVEVLLDAGADPNTPIPRLRNQSILAVTLNRYVSSYRVSVPLSAARDSVHRRQLEAERDRNRMREQELQLLVEHGAAFSTNDRLDPLRVKLQQMRTAATEYSKFEGADLSTLDVFESILGRAAS